jgi:hypothetical protein
VLNLREVSLNRTLQGRTDPSARKQTLEDTRSGMSFDLYASPDNKLVAPLIPAKSSQQNKVKLLEGKLKEVVKKFLVEEKEMRKTQQNTKTGFFQKKLKQTDQKAKAAEITEDLTIQDLVKKMKGAQKTLYVNLVARYQSMVKYWEKAYIFRYRIADFRRGKNYNQKKYLISKQEKHLIEMENLYGKRQAAFLRGTYMKKSRSNYREWEKKYKFMQAKIDMDIKTSEEKMFKNTFKFIQAFLYSDEDLSMINLKEDPIKKKIGYDNVGQRHLMHYMLNALEICDLIVSETCYWIGLVEQYVGPKFEQQHIDSIRSMLDVLLSIFRTRAKHEDLLGILQTHDKRVWTIMQEKSHLVPDLIDEWFLNCTENELLEIKMASLFSAFYKLSGNIEKSYMLMARAYKENKKVSNHN